MNPVVKSLIDTVGNVNTRPVFCPAIYDLKPRLANCDPADYARDTNGIVTALEKEINLFNLKVITSAYDIYNIEAEAVGAKVSRRGHNMPYIESPMIDSPDDISRLKQIENPAGRMNIFIDAAKAISNNYPNIYVRCGISGPFSMASKIYSGDKLLTDCILNGSKVTELMRFCTDTIKVYMKGIIRNRIDVMIFDSFASPPLISPEIYRDLVFPFHKELFDYLTENGILYKPLILGGNSYLLLDHLTETGANSFLLDYNTEDTIRESIVLKYKNFAFRINIDPSLIINGDMSSIPRYMEYFLNRFGKFKNIIIGTGILPYNTSIENLNEVHRLINEHSRLI